VGLAIKLLGKPKNYHPPNTANTKIPMLNSHLLDGKTPLFPVIAKYGKP
jgi:hypothetical protein